MEKVFDPDKYDHVAYQKLITGDEHHIFTADTKSAGKAHSEQLGYRVSHVRPVLSILAKDPVMLANFSNPEDSTGLNFQTLLAQNKIVIIRFKAGQGPAAQILGRFAKEKFFQDVYRLLDDGHQPPSNLFFIGDEFQGHHGPGAGQPIR